MTPGHVAINIDGGFKATARNLASFTSPNLASSDFRSAANRNQTDTAHARLIFGGYAFEATVYMHHGDETPVALSDVNSVLNSLTATERSCPCR